MKTVCWRLEERGMVGETPLHVCLLKATSIYVNLARRMLRIYPKLALDFYFNDEYYGNQNLLSHLVCVAYIGCNVISRYTAYYHIYCNM